MLGSTLGLASVDSTDMIAMGNEPGMGFVCITVSRFNNYLTDFNNYLTDLHNYLTDFNNKGSAPTASAILRLQQLRRQAFHHAENPLLPGHRGRPDNFVHASGINGQTTKGLGLVLEYRL